VTVEEIREHADQQRQYDTKDQCSWYRISDTKLAVPHKSADQSQ